MSHPSSNGSLSASLPASASFGGGDIGVYDPPSFENTPEWVDSPLDNKCPHGSTRTGSQTLIQGKKKALCIGINYRTIQHQELEGCVNDANNMANFLIHHLGFPEQNIIKLTDDTTNPDRWPTRANIISAMNWLAKDAKPGDSLFFHFSGHGGQVEDLEGDEIDGYDEVIYPIDFEANGHPDDDMMHDLIVRPLPPGCRLTALFDCSHSGSALDLPYVYTSRGRVKEPSRLVDVGKGLLDAGRSSVRGDMKGMLKGFGSMYKTETHLQKKAARYAKKTRASPADVTAWAGCKDFERSDDVVDDDKAIGAMSYAFTAALRRQPQQSYQELLNNIRDLLQDKYDQKPQLTSSHPIDTSAPYVI